MRIQVGACSRGALAVAIAVGAANAAWAQNAPLVVPASSAEDDSPQGSDEIVVTGSRAEGRLAADSAAPIQVFSEAALSRVGQPNLNQMLTQLVPSFQAQTQGGDLANFSKSARLRGLNPNHTLVMVNGKRRHGNSILQVVNSAYGGSAAPSIDLIPPDIVARIEILQDGAAAQYGSDAIAGVINIILKTDTSGGRLNFSSGQYYDGEGTSYSASGNVGLPLGDRGYLDISLFHHRSALTTSGDGQFAVRNLDGSTVTNISAAFRPIYESLNANGTVLNGGQPQSELSVAFFNAGYDFGDIELYSFGNISRRHGLHRQAYRPPNRVCATNTDPTTCFAETVLTGFVPILEVIQNEFSLTAGVRGSSHGWDWDLTASYSEDKSIINMTNSANVSLWQDSFRAAAATPTTTDSGFTPRNFANGGFAFTQFIATLDVRRQIDAGMAEPLTFAVGAEYRNESYEISAGDAASTYKEGGQGFPGFLASDAGLSKREAEAIYANVIAKPSADWTIDIAARYEHYSDFGSTTIGKITSRYDFSPAFAIRGTVSTGFRAPTMAESNYSATSVGPATAIVQLAPNSPGSTALGFGPLKPEKSTNFSGGMVFRPVPKMVITLDGYYIKIRDRVVSSGQITGRRNRVPVLTPIIGGKTPFDAVNDAVAASGRIIDPAVGTLGVQTFTNGIDTRTVGVELAARYPVELDFGRLDLSVGANYNDTKVIASHLGTLFNAQAEAIIETSSPKFKAIAGALLTSGPFSVNARATYYSSSTLLFSPAVAVPSAPIAGNLYPGVVKAAIIADLDIGFEITKWATLSVGANNLFNKKPELPGIIPVAVNSGTSPYINGAMLTPINAPFNFGPYGTNGGYYYMKISFKF